MDQRDALPHAHRAAVDMDAQCDKLAVDRRTCYQLYSTDDGSVDRIEHPFLSS